ncbi:MAG: formylglycine-generating enzyme family protein [Verrucomicrobia bacterium]|nr:formylglycine-generating enzyme family protein [Verrucomicrobiota bacterium]
MLRSVVTAFTWLALIAVPGVAAELAKANPAGNASNTPRFGQNFTVAHPAIAMIWIAPGTFLMSSTHGAGDDTLVTLTRGYWLGRTEVTQGQWQAVIDRVPVPSFFKGSDRPVEQVGWDLVMEFCLKLTERERTAGRLPQGYAYTLPTEAQWEFACRAGTTGKYAGEIEAMAWYDANSGGQTHPVAQKQPNAWGFHDMHGNVAEWCVDWYAGYAGGRVNDPTGTGARQFHILRGGSWGVSAGICRSAFRHWNPTNAGSYGIGFRLALAPQIGPPAEGKWD